MTGANAQSEGAASPIAADSSGRAGPSLPVPECTWPDWLSFGVTALTSFLVFVCTLAPEVTLRFSGFLTVSAAYTGVADPPGHPAWTLYSWVFTKLWPFGNEASRVALGSAASAALACGLIALTTSRLGPLLVNRITDFYQWKQSARSWTRVVCGFAAGM